MPKPTFTIIGYGRAGQAFEKALKTAGYTIASVYKTEQDLGNLNVIGEMVMITTPDSVIQETAEFIASGANSVEGKCFVHCSGTLPSSVLQSLKDKGAEIACFHPIQAITPETDSFKGSWFDIEGDESALKHLKKLATYFEAETLVVSPEDKEMLHVAAVMASNYMVTLSSLAASVSTGSNLNKSEVLKALLPLMNSTLSNLEKLSPEEALTGPIARGDIETVRKHVKFLKNKGELLSIYKKLGVLTLELVNPEVVEEPVVSELRKLLS